MATDEHRLNMLEQGQKHIASSVDLLTQTMALAVDSVNRLTILAEKVENHKDSIGRAFTEQEEIKKEIKDQSKSITDLEKAIIPLQSTTTIWNIVQKVVIVSIVGAIVGMVVIHK